MLLTFKQKLNLTKEQMDIFKATSQEARLLYNNLLERKITYYKETKNSLGYYELQKTLKDWKCDYLTYDMKKEICRLLDNNFKSFFELNKRNKNLNPHPPTFRGKNYFFTLSFVQDFIIEGDILKLSNKKCRYLKIKIKHNFDSETSRIRNKTKNTLKQCKIIKQDNDYFTCIVYEIPETNLQETNKLLAIDLGKKNIVSYYDEQTNTGCTFNADNFYKNQKYFDKRIDELKGLRDKKQKGSLKWIKLNQKKRQLENKKKRQTMLSLHKMSKELVKTKRDLIIGELTNLKSNIMSDYRKMNRQMQNNWQLKIFVDQLDYKCKKYGRKLTKINEAYTSKTCCHCGSINHGLTPSIRTYKCEECGFVIDRDINGSINILQRYKQIEMGDYSTPLWESLISQERFFGNFQKTNQFFINLD